MGKNRVMQEKNAKVKKWNIKAKTEMAQLQMIGVPADNEIVRRQQAKDIIMPLLQENRGMFRKSRYTWLTNVANHPRSRADVLKCVQYLKARGLNELSEIYRKEL